MSKHHEIKSRKLQCGKRNGATLVEMVVVLPVFGIFLIALMEFGYASMVVTMLKAARYGVGEDISTEQIALKTQEILASTFDTNAATIFM